MQKGSVDEGATPALKGVHFLLGASQDHGGAGDSSGGSQTPTDAAAAMMQGRDTILSDKMPCTVGFVGCFLRVLVYQLFWGLRFVVGTAQSNLQKEFMELGGSVLSLT